jgi:hypothetical protein
MVFYPPDYFQINVVRGMIVRVLVVWSGPPEKKLYNRK